MGGAIRCLMRVLLGRFRAGVGTVVGGCMDEGGCVCGCLWAEQTGALILYSLISTYRKQ